MNIINRQFRIYDYIYFCVAVVLFGIFSYFNAIRFENPLFPNRTTFFLNTQLFSAIINLGISFLISWVYSCFCKSASWFKVTTGVFIMVLCQSAIYSIVREDVVLVVLTSLFCFPGAVIGAALALSKR